MPAFYPSRCANAPRAKQRAYALGFFNVAPRKSETRPPASRAKKGACAKALPVALPPSGARTVKWIMCSWAAAVPWHRFPSNNCNRISSSFGYFLQWQSSAPASEVTPLATSIGTAIKGYRLVFSPWVPAILPITHVQRPTPPKKPFPDTAPPKGAWAYPKAANRSLSPMGGQVHR